jgi:DNA-binding response OmpR family regulator
VNTILVVDDEQHIVQLVKLYLTKEGYQVETASDGPQALQKVRQAKPDLVVLDIMLPGIDGLEVCRQIRRESDVPVIMLTARGDDIDKVVGLEIGADDYVTKPFNPRELVARTKAVLRRYHPDSAHGPVIEVGDLLMDLSRREASVAGQPVRLRTKEFDLLAAFAGEPGVVLSREKLLSQVWGYDYYGESRTIDVHVTWLRDKLKSSETVKIQTVWGVGYKLVVGAPAGSGA